ncbi:MAG: hypothetical protein A2Y14_02735 [Verrucomicrobia bacterium GWF2_51_19]|nr:MAG: hypothetical protein A2Y14_02735 [Verrucomicrobia bacterium GWF2_51_19]HCJ12258.1 hypothetical protein [Opitutae bacterium]
MAQKKVLFFSENPISQVEGGGIVVYSVLQGLRPENLLGFYHYRHITISEEYSQRFFYFPTWRMKKMPLFFDKQANVTSLLQPFWAWLYNGLIYFNREHYGRQDFRKMLAKVDEHSFRPDVVYFSGESYQFLSLAYRASIHFDVPIVMLNMDNWMGQERERYGYFGNVMYRKIRQLIQKVGRRSLNNTTNSLALAKHIEEWSGVPHQVANNCCTDLHPGPYVPNKKRIITYVGALNRSTQGRTLLLAIAPAITELAAEGVPVELHIYTQPTFATVANGISSPGAVLFKGYVARQNLAQVYANADLLLTPTTFLERELTLFRYSLSTKLSEYLCMGRPVISAGHPDWNLQHYVKEHGCGFTIDILENFKISEIKKAIRAIVETPDDTLIEIGKRNRNLWEQAHDVAKMATETRAALGL